MTVETDNDTEPCVRCGTPGEKKFLVKDHENVRELGAVCDVCFEALCATARELSDKFHALLDAGVSRDEANARMLQHMKANVWWN